jgi:hypothetical protein
MASCGRMFHLPLFLPVIFDSCSRRHVLCIPFTNCCHACYGTTCFIGCGMSHDFHSFKMHFIDLDMQVFYGRYLKRLSNQTQEALGEMTKVYG